MLALRRRPTQERPGPAPVGAAQTAPQAPAHERFPADCQPVCACTLNMQDRRFANHPLNPLASPLRSIYKKSGRRTSRYLDLLVSGWRQGYTRVGRKRSRLEGAQVGSMLPAFAVAGSVSPWATEKARVIAQRIAELAEFREIFRSSFLEAPASIDSGGSQSLSP